MTYYTPLALPWSTLTAPPLSSNFLVSSPSNPNACTCGRYTFLRACSCIHATASRPCGRTHTARGAPTFCMANPPHHYVADFVVSDECEDHPGYKLRPWPYTTVTPKKTTTTTTTNSTRLSATTPRLGSITNNPTQRIIPTTAGCGINMATASASVGGQTAPMAKV